MRSFRIPNFSIDCDQIVASHHLIFGSGLFEMSRWARIMNTAMEKLIEKTYRFDLGVHRETWKRFFNFIFNNPYRFGKLCKMLLKNCFRFPMICLGFCELVAGGSDWSQVNSSLRKQSLFRLLGRPTETARIPYSLPPSLPPFFRFFIPLSVVPNVTC